MAKHLCGYVVFCRKVINKGACVANRSVNPEQILQQSEIIYTEEDVRNAIAVLAKKISARIAGTEPLVMCVMGGAVVFSGQLLPQLGFPLEFDYVQASRYHEKTEGEQLVWTVEPRDNVRGKTVLLLDDILDEGHTLAAIREKCLAHGAAEVVIAVLVEKDLERVKPIQADYVGLSVPNRYVFGCGMDVYGWWRNLPAIYALNVN
ncbi:hypoxanthine-guanine phosphoribosyltransferase [Methylovorus mays]|nr:hypoxanthine-guanine phosphoribosyltransferase [Methylovorus mays]